MVVVCPNVVVSFASQLLAIGTVAGAIAGTSALAFLFSRTTDSGIELDANPQRKQKALEKARGKAMAVAAPAATAGPKPRVVTQMKDLKLLQSVLAQPGRTLTATDSMLVLTMREATLSFMHNADGAIVAELQRGDAEAAKSVLRAAQPAYLAAVRELTAARVQAQAPAAGWKVAAREVARDGSVQITLQKPRAKKAVAIG